MTHQLIPRLLFVGAGNIAQSIMKGILKAQPDAARQILATAPTSRNLNVIEEKLGCQVSLLRNVRSRLIEFNPDFVFICVKPQVLMTSITTHDILLQLLSSVPHKCIMLSLLAGIRSQVLATTLNQPERNIVRLMLNTAAELGASSVFYYPHPGISSPTEDKINNLFQLIGHPIVKLHDETLMDVATGVCGSGIAFVYEFIQAMCDISVKNGIRRDELSRNATQLIKETCELLLTKRVHPYEARDDVIPPAGSAMFGLAKWQELSISHKIGRAFQASIDRSKSLSLQSESKLEDQMPEMLSQVTPRHSNMITTAELKTHPSSYQQLQPRPETIDKSGRLFQLIKRPEIEITDEKLLNLTSDVCISGAALACEFVQAISDIGVKNGFTRDVSTQNAAQVIRSACEMLLAKGMHPYQARDAVTSQGGTTIYGLDKWHELSINNQIGQAFQAAIERFKSALELETKMDDQISKMM